MSRWAWRARLLLVTDGAGWVIDQMAATIRRAVPLAFRARVTTPQVWHARRCLVHFIHRGWAWSEDYLSGVHSSNCLIGLWWHGRLDVPDPAVHRALERVQKVHVRFARIQVTCSSAKDTMLAIGVPVEKIAVLPMGVDLARFHPPASPAERQRLRRRWGVPPQAIAVGCFVKDGQGWGEGLVPKLIKGPDLLVEALSRLARCYPIYAVIPGPARGYVKRRLAQAGVPYYAPGHVTTDSYYHGLDCYLSPSRDEGGPAGVLEAMASGVPVVSTRAGMAVDVIQDGVNGLLVDVEDVEGLIQAVSRLIEDSAMRRRCAEQALMTIQAYHWPVLARRYVDELYQPLMQAIG